MATRLQNTDSRYRVLHDTDKSSLRDQTFSQALQNPLFTQAWPWTLISVPAGSSFSKLLLLLSRFSRVWLCATPQMEAHQAPPSLGFSGQEHWSGLSFPSPMHESENWKWSRPVVSDSSRPHGLQPTRLLCPWDFPGKCTGVGCHCLLQISAMAYD